MTTGGVMKGQSFIRGALAILLIGGQALAQADRWNELTAQVTQLYASGKASDAVPLAKEAVEVAKKTFGAEHPNYGISLNNLALAQAALGQYSDADSEFKKSIAVLEKCQCGELARPLGNLATMLSAQSKYSDAQTVATRAVDVTQQYYGAQSANTAMAEEVLAQIYAKGGRFVDAERTYKQALSIQQEALPPDHVDIGRTYGNLAYLYESEGNRVAAGNAYEQALAIFQKTLPEQDPLIAMTRASITRVGSGGTSGGPGGPDQTALFQQCMDYKINLCMQDCMGNYGFKESKCRKELCSITNPKSGPSNRNLWTRYCQRKVEKEVNSPQ
jgi:tetratricopeptide (TPR) repeat protein